MLILCADWSGIIKCIIPDEIAIRHIAAGQWSGIIDSHGKSFFKDRFVLKEQIRTEIGPEFQVVENVVFRKHISEKSIPLNIPVCGIDEGNRVGIAIAIKCRIAQQGWSGNNISIVITDGKNRRGN